jgi:preprotein translocase subunit YajC
MPPSGANPFMNLVPLIGIFIIFYFLLIKPQKKKEQEHQEMLKTLAKNDDVITSSGIHGTIVNVKDTTVIVRVDDNVKLEIEKSAVSVVKKKTG